MKPLRIKLRERPDMKRLMTLVTIIWILAYGLSFVGGTVGYIADLVALIVGLAFVAELINSYRHSKGMRDFLRGNAHELLMVVPVFRCLRMFRALKRFRRILVMLDNSIEGIDIILRVKLPALIRKIRKSPKRAI